MKHDADEGGAKDIAHPEQCKRGVPGGVATERGGQDHDKRDYN